MVLRRLGTLLLAGLILAPACSDHAPATTHYAPAATAEAIDSFGLGEGRSGALTVTTAATVINTYAPIVSVGSPTQITVGPLQGAAGPFNPGDLLLLWRTTGITAVSASQATFLLGSDVGGFEFGRVKSVSGSTVTFTNPLGSTTRYATGSQVVRVPEYTTASIAAGSGVSPYAWDGSSGGIVIFLATGAVTNAGSVVADGAGFRGGGLENAAMATVAPDCTQLDGSDEASPCGGAHKGEGLDPASFAAPSTPVGQDPSTSYGFGNYANGAGGGDARNAGGGGGGGIGEGGSGGETTTADGSRAVGGMGGAPVTFDPTTGFMSLGGGGGAGDEDHGSGTAGGTGGGIVLIRAASFGGTGAYSANGASVTATAGTDGSGGGGGGGAVLLFSGSTVACGSASANGGSGGSGGSEPDGPGGGGGGGLVYLESTMTTCFLSASGGQPGTSDAASVMGQTYGATVGASGEVNQGGTSEYGGGVCTAALVGMNRCGGCVADSDCGTGQLCNVATNKCGGCNGNQESDASAPCPAATPFCITTGPSAGTCGACATGADCTTAAAPACSTASFTCTACNGDQGTTAPAACPTTTAPYCQPAGTCGKCTSNSDCATSGIHLGTQCNAMTGACGDTCTMDSACGSGQWCDNLSTDADGGAGTCAMQVGNGQMVPGGMCTSAIAARACASGVCGTSDNLCGLADGALCTPGDAGSAECRSGVCVGSGGNEGHCEQCATDADCAKTPATPACSPSNQCAGCSATNSSMCTGTSPICDTTNGVCTPCEGDLGTPRGLICVSSTAPYCFASGACGTCTASTQCAGSSHSGPVCESTGACGTACTTAAQCGAGYRCVISGGAGTCVSEIPDAATMSDAAVMRDGGATPPAVDAALPGAGVSIEGGALSCSAGGAGSHRPAATFPWLLGLLLGGAMRRRRAS